MLKFTSIKKKARMAALAVALSLTCAVLQTGVAHAAANLCHDTGGGVTYACQNTKGQKVDGKVDAKFDTSKCYVYRDPNKGWQALSCTDAVFTSVTTIPTPAKTPDSAASKACPKELKAQVKGGGEAGCDLVARYINPLITVLTAAVGLIVVIAIIIGAIQYSTARNNPQAIQAAKSRISNALLGLLAFFLLWSFIQYILPGGIFKT